MQPDWEIFQAMLHCHYKAWLLAKYKGQLTTTTDPGTTITLPIETLTRDDKLVLTALYVNYSESVTTIRMLVLLSNDKTVRLKLKLNSAKARKLYSVTLAVINEETPPLFYKNPHCPECAFRDKCYQKLMDRNCISLLGGMPLKVILKFHKRGVYSIKGFTSNGILNYPVINQQAAQLDAIGKVILENKRLPAHITGEEGLRDINIIESIYKSA